jgi:hypothetical protein
MEAMPRPRPPYLSREVTRHGTPVWYVRRDGKRIRLRAEYGTPEFDAEYQAAEAKGLAEEAKARATAKVAELEAQLAAAQAELRVPRVVSPSASIATA